jgi:hypothetical protein
MLSDVAALIDQRREQVEPGVSLRLEFLLTTASRPDARTGAFPRAKQ